MNSQYLSKDGDCLSFRSLDDFNTAVQNLDLSVPARDDARKSYHRERVCAVRYLKAAILYSQIDFPFSICKSESPDFILHLSNGKTIGLEHRDISTEEWQESLTCMAKKLREEPILFGNLPGSDWDQDQVNSEWARLALFAVSDKIEKLNGPHYKKLDSYELLLYSNTGLPNITQDDAMSKLSHEFNNKYASTNFDRLFQSLTIIYGDEVWLRRLHFRNAS